MTPMTSMRRCSFGFAATTAMLLVTPAFGQIFQDQTAARFPAPNPTDYTNYVEVCDIDGDGDLDLLFANGGGFSAPNGSPELLRVFINDGTGHFTDETMDRTGGLTGRFRGVTCGDCDGDGDQDLIISQDFGNRPFLLINDGAGVFKNESGSRIPQVMLSSTRAQFGDIDNDGDLDIYINHGGATSRFGCGQNQIWINDGTGHYTDDTAARHPAGTVCQPMDVIFFDFDNDFDLDIRTGNRGTGNSKLYVNDGTGVFTAVGGVPSDSSCYSYDVGDMNGDGNWDMLGANAGPSNTEMLLRGDGMGGWTNISSQITPNANADDNDSKFFDFDADGDMDFIIAALFQNREKIYTNTDGQGSYSLFGAMITSVNDATLDVMVADFDGDGALDIVTGQGEAGSFQNRIFINTSNATDVTGPRVPHMEQLADTSNTTGPYAVRAQVTDDYTSDRGFYDRGVVLEYFVNDGPMQQTDMTWVGNALWRAELPGQPNCSTITYFVTATDWNNNTSSGPEHTFDVGGAAPVGDTNGDCVVNVDDLINVILDWGTNGSGNGGDVDGSGQTDVDDLVTVILNWTT